MESIESKKTGTALVRSRRRRWKTLAALVLAAFAFCILLMGRRKTFFGDGNVDIIISRTKLAGPDPGYQHISRSVVVSLETERFAYFTIRQGEMRVVIDGVGSPGYSMVYGLRFSNDGERVAYFGLLESDGKAYAFIDGRKEGPYEVSIQTRGHLLAGLRALRVRGLSGGRVLPCS